LIGLPVHLHTHIYEGGNLETRTPPLQCSPGASIVPSRQPQNGRFDCPYPRDGDAWHVCELVSESLEDGLERLAVAAPRRVEQHHHVAVTRHHLQGGQISKQIKSQHKG
jgi:hypothetical protein